jgi:predicted nucleotidyltransferase
MRDEILAALRSIEAEAQVRALLAVESGSRAWGFASPDSDYDVRFIYVHEPAWYLTVFESRDVIEKMLPGELDVSGWDLRKSLRLFSKCNLALNEWLGSPVVYSETSEFRSELRALIPMFFNPTRATHHYRSMANQALSNLTSENQISIKKLAARALLACRWIRQYRSQPPTEFHVVVEHVASVDERTYFADLQGNATRRRKEKSSSSQIAEKRLALSWRLTNEISCRPMCLKRCLAMFSMRHCADG